MSRGADRADQAPSRELEVQTRQLVRLVARLLRHARVQADAVPAELQELLQANGLGLRHLSVLIALAVNGPASVNQLAEHTALAPPTTSLLTNELRRAGLVHRQTDPADRRRAVISIRDDLRPGVAALAERRLHPLRVTLQRLSAAERASFLHGWQLLVEAHEQGEPRQPAPRQPHTEEPL